MKLLGDVLDNGFFTFALWLNVVIFAVYMIAVAFVLIKIKCHLDKVAILTIVTYSLSLTIRMLNWAFTDDYIKLQKYIELAFSISAILIWVITYYFILEMQYVKSRLQSSSYTDLIHRAKQSRRMKVTMIAILVILFLIIFTINAMRLLSNTSRQDESQSMITLFCVAVGLKLIMDLCLYIIFSRLIYFFIVKKKQKLQALNKKFTCFNWFIVLVIIYLVLLNALHSVGTCVFGILSCTSFNDNPYLSNYFTIQRSVSIPFNDFLNALILLYLFYHQGTFFKNQRHRPWENEQDETSTTQNLIDILKNNQTQDNNKGTNSKGTATTINEVNIYYYNGDIHSDTNSRQKGVEGESQDSDDEESTTFRSFLYYQIAVQQHLKENAKF